MRAGRMRRSVCQTLSYKIKSDKAPGDEVQPYIHTHVS